MKKKWNLVKRTVAILLVLVLQLSLLCACTGESNVSGDSGNILDQRTVNVTIMRNLWSDRNGEQIIMYAKLIEAELNVKFDLMTIGGTAAEDVIAGTESAVAKGADIIISGIADGLVQSCSIAQEANVGFAMCYAMPTEEVMTKLAEFDNYLGTFVNAIDNYRVGADMANTLMDEGYKKFGVVGFTEGLLEASDVRIEGFVETVESRGGTIVSILREMPGSSMITAVSTWLEAYGDELEYINAQGGGANFVGPALTATGYSIPISVPAIPSDYETYFNSGVLDYVISFSDDLFVVAVAVGINWLNNQPAAGTPKEGVYESDDVILRTLDDNVLYAELTDGTKDYTYTMDELRSMITAYNPDVTYEDILGFCQSTSIEGIQARHAEK